ncbi:MAG: hypothetical protein LBR56_07675 [Sporomusaceae bacterium]|jgi:hypothetical protein|nr:hypothetical protein [Sporomusaceae bacterium]
MLARRVVIMTLAVLLIGSAAIWLYSEADVPKKIPARARQVFFLEEKNFTLCGMFAKKIFSQARKF